MSFMMLREKRCSSVIVKVCFPRSAASASPGTLLYSNSKVRVQALLNSTSDLDPVTCAFEAPRLAQTHCSEGFLFQRSGLGPAVLASLTSVWEVLGVHFPDCQ